MMVSEPFARVMAALSSRFVMPRSRKRRGAPSETEAIGVLRPISSVSARAGCVVSTGCGHQTTRRSVVGEEVEQRTWERPRTRRLAAAAGAGQRGARTSVCVPADPVLPVNVVVAEAHVEAHLDAGPLAVPALGALLHAQQRLRPRLQLQAGRVLVVVLRLVGGAGPADLAVQRGHAVDDAVRLPAQRGPQLGVQRIRLLGGQKALVCAGPSGGGTQKAAGSAAAPTLHGGCAVPAA